MSYSAIERPTHCSSIHMFSLSWSGLWMSHWDFSPSAGGRRDHSGGEPRGGCFFAFFWWLMIATKKKQKSANTPPHHLIRGNDWPSMAKPKSTARMSTGGQFWAKFTPDNFDQLVSMRCFKGACNTYSRHPACANLIVISWIGIYLDCENGNYATCGSCRTNQPGKCLENILEGGKLILKYLLCAIFIVALSI